jgi:prolyl-tRNA synthetase
MGTVIEVNRDQKGIIWPEEVAPYKYYLIEIGETKKEAEKLYEELTQKGIEVLYDDRDVSAGEKFVDADLIGLPYRLVVSAKNNGKIELKKRSEEKTELVELENLL